MAALTKQTLSFFVRFVFALALTLELAGCPAAPEAPVLDAGGDAGSDARIGVDAPDGGCTGAGDCDDGVFCNGAETCVSGACEAGAAPCGAGMTCDEAADRCDGCAVRDADGDGAASMACGGLDCDDTNPNRRPGASEICDAADLDEDCDVTTFGYRDADSDLEPDAACCNAEGATMHCGSDCDDFRPSVNPRQVETCDGLDNDCDGPSDEGVRLVFSPDTDGDDFGDPAGTTVMACAAPAGYAAMATDCDDTNGAIHPAAVEQCDLALVDENCDGVANPTSLCMCSGDITRTCARPGACAAGTERCVAGGWGMCSITGTTETCNSIDDDCDGMTDEMLTVLCYLDPDNDGYPAGTAASASLCPDPSRPTFGMCPTNYTYRVPGSSDDCVPDDPAISPGASESCNDLDDDCDGVPDDGVRITCFADGDGDGYGAAGAAMSSECPASGRTDVGGCPVGRTNRAPAAGTTDCDDTDAMIHPGGVEVCVSGLTNDDDCDGFVDEGVSAVCYADVDNDTYAPAGATMTMLCRDTTRSAVGFCPISYTNRAPSSPATTDCEDSYVPSNPAGTEVCDTDMHDEDCDGSRNEGCSCAGSATQSCPQPGICAMGIQTCSAGAWGPCSVSATTEICDTEDDDCDGSIDEGTTVDCYADPDGDGFAAAGTSPVRRCTCSAGSETTTPPSGGNVDCAPTDGLAHPGAVEVCDRIDRNCSSGGGTALEEDVDGDFHAASATTVCAGGYPADDCDDGNASVYPGQFAYFSSARCFSGDYFCAANGRCLNPFRTCYAAQSSGYAPSWDYNCDGAETPEPDHGMGCSVAVCSMGCGGGGGIDYTTAACGGGGTRYVCFCEASFGFCNSTSSASTIGCR